MLLGVHSAGVLEDAAEVQHGKHGDDHHDALEQQRELKLLSDPTRMWTQREVKSNEGNLLIQPKRETCTVALPAHRPYRLMDYLDCHLDAQQHKTT